MNQPVYVSITGLKLRRIWWMPLFWYHAVAAMTQAKSAPGCLRADARRINGVHHTLTVWDNKASMRAYLTTGAHLRAMPLFHRMATGKTFGFETVDIPDWEEVHRLWLIRANSV
ncbi:hypothetical protein [Phaeobacter sp.]|uniref:hypothetical protein n=1 Tax=Phaeobacter sp. TaxID=1902409 RepID=UPI0025F90728|nr:hypothetical protein [Phaeobacter sp.]